MKKKIIIVLVLSALLTVFAGCGGIKKGDVMGEWVFTYSESPDGTRERQSSISSRVMGEIKITENTFEIVYDWKSPVSSSWKVSGSGKITPNFSDDEFKKTYYYKDNELIIEYEDGSKMIYTRKY